MATEEEDELAAGQEEGSLFDSPEIISFRRQVSLMSNRMLRFLWALLLINACPNVQKSMTGQKWGHFVAFLWCDIPVI